MKPVMQTTFMGALTKPIEEYDGNERGNCLQAAMASIFELPLEDIPHFVSYPDWHTRLQNWLAERNLTMMFSQENPWNAYYIKCGLSPRSTNPEFPMYHATVAYNGDIIHDPHPEGGGLQEHTGNYVFVAKDVSLC